MIYSMDKRAQDMGMKDYIIGPVVCWSPVPPWFLPEPTVDFLMLDQVKEDNGDPVAMVCEQLKGNRSGSVQIYTDGSMNPLEGKAAIGISITQLCIKQGFRLPDNMSVFSKELVAILWAPGWESAAHRGILS